MFVMLLIWLLLVAAGTALPVFQDLPQDTRVVVMFTSQWCFKSMQTAEFIHKIAHKHPDLVFKETADQALSQKYAVTSYPTLVMLRDGTPWVYQYDISEKELNYWLAVYFRGQFPIAPSLDMLLKSNKQAYTLVVPAQASAEILREFAIQHPIVQVTTNSSSNSNLCQFVNQPGQSLLQKSANSLSECLSSSMGHLHLHLGWFDHRVRIQMINNPYIGVALFHNDTTEGSLASRYRNFTRGVAARLNGNQNIRLDYNVLTHHPQNKYLFVDGYLAKRMNRLLMQFLNIPINNTPVVVAFSFHKGTLKSSSFKLDNYHTFANSFLYWLSMRKHSGDQEPKKGVYCPQPKVIHLMRYNSLQDVILNAKLSAHCRSHSLSLETDQRRWHTAPGVYYCHHTSLQIIPSDPVGWLSRQVAASQPQEL